MATKKDDKKRANGGGSIYQRKKDGKWIAALSLPSLPGKPARRKVKVGRDEKHAKRLLGEMRRELDKSGDLMTRVPTMKEWSKYWLGKVCKPSLKPRSYDDYESIMRLYVNPFFGGTKIDKITPAAILNLYDWIQKPKSKEGLELSSTTALRVHRVLKKSLKDAERLAGLPRNPVNLVDAPSLAVSTTQKTITAEQALNFLQHFASDPYVARYATGFFSGARQGEILGLQIPFVTIYRDKDQNPIDCDLEFAWNLQRLTWRHGCLDTKGEPTCKWKRGVDCPQKNIEIPAKHEAIQAHGGLYLTRPKTKKSWRVTAGGPMLALILDRIIADRTDGFVFTTQDGNPIDPRVDWEIWKNWLKEVGLPHIGIHGQRHTASTLQAMLGTDEKTRMDMLGHTSTQINRRYTHDDMSLQRAAAKRLSDALSFDFKATGPAQLPTKPVAHETTNPDKPELPNVAD